MKGIVILAHGPQPIDFMTKGADLAGEGAVICATTANMAGATFAVGHPEALAALQERLKPGAVELTTEDHKGSDLSAAATEWLASGKRGVSSNTIFSAITGIDVTGSWGEDHPWDPADFERCRMLFEKCPEFWEQRDKMRSVSPEWNALIDSWEELCDTLDTEAPDFRHGEGRATKTYARMKEIFASAHNHK